MKKTILWVLAAVVAAAAGAWAYRANSAPAPAGPASSVSSVSLDLSSASSGPASSEPAASQGASGQKLTDGQITEKIKKEIPLDWEKYTIREEQDKPVSIGGKTYRTYGTWDADYQEGPLILVDPDDGQLYTYVTGDAKPVPAAEDPAYGKTVRTVTGAVEDAAMMSVIIRTEQGNKLTIRRIGVELKNLDEGFRVGSYVKVTYTGTYSGDSSQRMFVKKIEGVRQ